MRRRPWPPETTASWPGTGLAGRAGATGPWWPPPGIQNKDVKNETLDTPESRLKAISKYSHTFRLFNENVMDTYNNHNPNSKILVKYEHLKNDTFIELKKIYDFIGIQIPDKNLQKQINKFDFSKIPLSKKGSGKFTRSATPARTPGTPQLIWFSSLD